MKKYNIPDELEPCCELCEYSSRIEATGELLCKYKCKLKVVSEDDICRKFSFNIFSYQPKVSKQPKHFDFTKI